MTTPPPGQPPLPQPQQPSADLHVGVHPQLHPQPEYYAPGWQTPRPPLDGVAVASFVTGLLVLGPVAVVLGILGLLRVRRRGTRGRGLALVGIVLGAAGMVVAGVVAALVVAALAATRPLAVDIEAPQTVYVQQLGVGHCLAALPADGVVETLEAVPCTTQHTAEVLHSADLTGAWPGQEEADRQAAATCDRSMSALLTGEQQAAGVEWVVWAPTAASWRAGDRAALCVAHAPGTPLTSSLRDGGTP